MPWITQQTVEEGEAAVEIVESVATHPPSGGGVVEGVERWQGNDGSVQYPPPTTHSGGGGDRIMLVTSDGGWMW